jgi:hypothetical protein
MLAVPAVVSWEYLVVPDVVGAAYLTAVRFALKSAEFYYDCIGLSTVLGLSSFCLFLTKSR